MPLNALETSVVGGFRSGGSVPSDDPDKGESWVAFGLHAALVAGGSVREARGERGHAMLKDDGSPHTELELTIEEVVRVDLARFAPDAVMVGEESGGRMSSDGFVVAIDPVDGTWAFLSQTETYSTTLNVFRDGEPYFGIVSNPATGEVGYALAGHGTRLVRLDLFGEGDAGMDLPLRHFADGKLLVNLHPGRASGGVQRALHEQWTGGPVRMVRSPGGSPAWALLDAARGHYTYANVWSKRPAEPWDLTAGLLLMRGAGGDVVDLERRSIDPVAHSGPFVAGVDERGRDAVVEILRGALSQ